MSNRATVPILALFAALGLYRYTHAGFVDSGRSMLEHAAFQNVQLWHYLTMLAYPSSLSIDHDPESIPFGLAMLAVAASIVLIYISTRWMVPPLQFFAAWIAITLFPRFIVNIPEFLAERHLYMPMVGISAIAAIGITKLLAFTERTPSAV